MSAVILDFPAKAPGPTGIVHIEARRQIRHYGKAHRLANGVTLQAERIAQRAIDNGVRINAALVAAFDYMRLYVSKTTTENHP